MIRTAEGGTGLLHNITKPTAWRGRVQIPKEEEEDANPSTRCEEKKKEWAAQWQCDTKVQDLDDKPCRNEELNNLEEEMSRILEKELEKAARTRQRREQDAMAFTQGSAGFN